jgi:DNA-directed RNA polymerase subunit H
MTSRIVSIYKSRRVLLEQLADLGFVTDDYATFTVNEIDAMLTTSQLDMLLTNETSKVYVKYPKASTSRNIQQKMLDELVEDLFLMEEVLSRNDTLIIMIDDEPNDSLLAKLRTMWDRDGIFILVHNMHRLQFNLLKHTLVPKHRGLSDDELQEVMKKYNIQDKTKFPTISRFDPPIMAIAVRPGQVVEIERCSPTAMTAMYYRLCV